MADQLKDIFFTPDSIRKLADTIKRFYPAFDKDRFLVLVFDEKWKSLEIKGKMRHTTHALHATLPKNYPKAIEILKKAASLIKGFEAMTLPDYVEVYGIGDWDVSLNALAFLRSMPLRSSPSVPFSTKIPNV